MASRLKLHDLLLSIVGPNVYYQIPSTFVMQYPCVKYSLDKIENSHADDTVYRQDNRYSIIVMSRMPDDSIVEKISKLPKCSFDRHYVQDNIHHTTFNLYY